MSPNAIFKGIYEHDTCDTRKLVAIARFEKFSDLACNFHLYVHTWLQKQGVATRAKDLAYNYVRDTTNMTKVIVMPPAVCEHVIAAAISWGCEHEATLKNCMTWRNKPVDLHIYSLEIKR